MDAVLDPLILARWQFGLTTLYHFIFVPITLGMILAIAIWQTLWVNTGEVRYLRLTKFFGKMFLINFTMGVVTGIVQEFQFGMNWSNFSRFVGDIFGAPLAFEGLLAFFFEATFIGLWIFGWDKLSPRIHLGCVWMVMFGTWASAYFILAANAFMQNPVGYRMNEETGRAELTDFLAVLLNPVALNAMPHTIFASIMVAAAIIIATSAWHLKRDQHVATFRQSLRFGLWFMLIGGAGVMYSGDQLGLVMEQTQPMKMAAAEALYNTAHGADASFSIFSLGTPDGSRQIFSIRIPYMLALLSTHTMNGTVQGINNLQQQYTDLFGPGDYSPIIWITFWAFRWMIGFGMTSIMIAIAGLFFTRRGYKTKKWMWNVAIWAAPLPLLAILVGWVFTEMGRQPWLVFSLLKTADGVSPNVSGLSVLISVVSFTLIYGILAVVEFKLLLKAAQSDPDKGVIDLKHISQDKKTIEVVEDIDSLRVGGSVY